MFKSTTKAKTVKNAQRKRTVLPPQYFVTDVLPANEQLKIQLPTKPVACPARVDVINYKPVNTSATIAAAGNTNLKTVPPFVCPATQDCINRKRGNRTARNARETITPTNPNKPHAKRVRARKKRRIQVRPFVSNARRGNLCPPTKSAHHVR
jgi:hypothetical protein